MKRYRARYDSKGKHSTFPTWLTDDNHITTMPKDAALLPLKEIVNLIAQMALTEPSTVDNGEWVLERKQRRWDEIRVKP